MTLTLPPVAFKCPCGTVIEVPVTCEIRVADGRQFLDYTPDYTDLWAHAWTHDTSVDLDEEPS